MSKLTLPIICAYLPFEVKVKHASGIWDVEGILNCEGGNADIMIGNQGYFQTIGIADFGKDYSLFLRPLSSLTKPIHHNGETFVPLVKLCDPDETDLSKMEAVEYNPFKKIWPDKIWYKATHSELGEILSVNPANPLVLPYHLVQKLIEWHFDVFGLLESGDALPIEEDGK